jgi:ribulose-5-phosphate 4-epimerase/fuculose-1-phosphate aldolase
MRGLIIRMTVYMGVIDFAHGQGFSQKRLLIPEQGNLMLWQHHGVPYVGRLPAEAKDYEVVSEIEIPAEVAERAQQLQEISATLTADIRALLGEE